VKQSSSGFISGSVGCAGGSLLESVDPFRIGMQECSSGPCAQFRGKIDDIRIYDRVLTDSEIEELAAE